MDRIPPINPYASPGSELNSGLGSAGQPAELASPGSRLAAVSLDGLLISVPLLPAFVYSAWEAIKVQALVREQALVDTQPLPTLGSEEGVLLAVVIGAGILAVLGVVIYQWILIARTGQSLGKKWTGIRIEKLDGTPLTFGSGVVVRNWAPKLLGAVPLLGILFQLVDCLFIFRADRRCLHDHMAGTRVVRVRQHTLS